MECRCPNCKHDAQRMERDHDGVEHIECDVCGWFEANEAGEFSPCEEPHQPTNDMGGAGPSTRLQPVPPLPDPIPSSVKPEGDGSALPSPEPAAIDDEVCIEIVFTDEN